MRNFHHPALLLSTISAIGLAGCSIFGPYSTGPTYAAGEEPSYNIGHITTSDKGFCNDNEDHCKAVGKLVLVPPSASMSFQIFKSNGDVVTCASPAEVAKALSSSGSATLSVPMDAGKAAAAASASGAATEAITLTQSADAASHFVAAASFYNCLGYASGYIDPASASQNQSKIIDNAIQIAAASSKAADSTVSTNSFQISGVIVGLKGYGLVLTDSRGEDISIASATQTFAFTSKIDKGKPYAVAVKTDPTTPTQKCSVTGNGTGIVSGDVKNVVITCT